MITTICGNIIQFNFDDSDIPSSGFAYIPYTLPDGYSIAKAVFRRNLNAGFFTDDTNAVELYTAANVPIEFPVVNGKSPNHVVIRLSSNAGEYDVISITIYKFGNEPDSNYFSSTFTPILVKTGREYNVIPSTQFHN